MIVVNVFLTGGGENEWLSSIPIEDGVGNDTTTEVQKVVSDFLQAEGQGSFVVETVDGWCCVPTRSIRYIRIEEVVSG